MPVLNPRNVRATLNSDPNALNPKPSMLHAFFFPVGKVQVDPTTASSRRAKT